jgi:hypothetical protein
MAVSFSFSLFPQKTAIRIFQGIKGASMKNKLLYLLLTVLLATVVTACSSGTEEIVPEATPTYLADLILRADAGNGEVKLDWLMDPGAETYNIYYFEDDGTIFPPYKPDYDKMKGNSIKIIGADQTPNITSATYTVTGLENGKKYWFSISAVQTEDTVMIESRLQKPTFSTPTNLPPPKAPEDFRANAGDQKVTVTWTPVPGADFYYLRCLWIGPYPNSGEGIIVVTNPAQSSQEFKAGEITWTVGPDTGTLAGLKNERFHAFEIYAIADNNGNGTFDELGDLWSSASFPAFATPTATPPPMAPVLTSVTADSANIVTLTWEASAGATSYNIYLGTAKGITKLTGVDGGDVGNVTTEYAGPLPIDTYYFVVTAKNANGESTESNEMSLTLTPP